MVDPKLYSLLKVYETGSFTRAAEELSLTQPAVSQHIHALENSLGVRVFDRSTNSLHVTREGELVVRCAKRISALYRSLEQDLKTERTRIISLTVGVTRTSENSLIAQALANYINRDKSISVKIITDTADHLYSRLKNYELNFAIAEGQSSDPKLKYLLLDTDCLVLAVSPNHPLAGRASATLDELKREKLILRLPSSGTRNLFVATLESRNLRIDDFNVVMEIDNIATIKDLVRRDFGVSVLPRSVCLNEIQMKKIVVLPIEDLTMIRETNLVYLQDFERPELLQGIVQEYLDIRGGDNIQK